MVFLLLTIICSTTIALILKVNENRNGDRILLLCGNYAVAALVSGASFWMDDGRAHSFVSGAFGLCLGMIFVFAFYAFSRAVQAAGTGIATLASRLSVVVPVVGAIVIFRENPDWFDALGFGFVGVTLLLFFASAGGVRQSRGKSSNSFFLIAVLLGIGCADFCMKVFQQTRPAAEKAFFIHCIFVSCLMITGTLVWRNRIQMNRETWFLGMVLGVPNLLSTVFLIGALTQLPAFVVFPAVNIGVVLLTTVAAAFVWREIPNRLGMMAMAAGIVAVALLSL